MIGFALFGALTYLPLFQQVVRGDSPTESGPAADPGDGRRADRLDRLGPDHHARPGRYKAFPIVGTAIAAVGMLLLVAPGRGRRRRCTRAVAMFVMGLGLGLVMQVLVLAVQNAVDYSELGVATSGATLFRSMGGSLGHGRARRDLHQPAHGRARGLARRAGRQRLDRPERAAAAAGGRSATATPARSPTRCRPSSSSPRRSSLVAFLLSWLIEERPLRQTVETAGVGEAFASPDERRLAARAHARAVPARRPRAHARVHRAHGRRRGRRPAARRRVAARAGRGGRALDDPEAIAADRADRRRVGPRRSSARSASAGSSATAHARPRTGHATAERLLDARRECLTALVADWEPDEDPRVNDAIARLAQELARGDAGGGRAGTRRSDVSPIASRTGSPSR